MAEVKGKGIWELVFEKILPFLHFHESQERGQVTPHRHDCGEAPAFKRTSMTGVLQLCMALRKGLLGRAEGNRFCDLCLIACPWSEFPAHSTSVVHRANLRLYRQAANVLFDRADEILHLCGGQWERCFSCVWTCTFTVMSFACGYCDGGGDRVPVEGIPGVPFRGGNSCQRFICRECAMHPYCRSCSSVFGAESLFLDSDALEEMYVDRAGTAPAPGH